MFGIGVRHTQSLAIVGINVTSKVCSGMEHIPLTPYLSSSVSGEAFSSELPLLSFNPWIIASHSLSISTIIREFISHEV